MRNVMWKSLGRSPAGIRLCMGWLLVCCLSMPRAAAAQPGSDGAEPSRPKVGLALSGGGAKGFAHLGVLKVLEEIGLPIDVITGTSMGAVIGGVYASGLPADSLEQVVLADDWKSFFQESLLRGYRGGVRPLRDEEFIVSFPLAGTSVELPGALISGQIFLMRLFRLTIPVHDVRDFRELPIPFAALAVDLETGEAVRLDHGYLPLVIRASAAMPSLFTPVEIDGRLYTDGAVMRPLPAEDARAMGADVVVCVDTSDPVDAVEELQSFMDYLGQAIGFHMRARLEAQKEHCDVLIRPDVQELSVLDFGDVPGLIRRGEEAARSMRPQLEALAAPAGRAGTSHRYLPEVGDTLSIAEVRVDGLRASLARQVRSALRIDAPARLTTDELEAAVLRAYDTELFEQVNYRLEGASRGDGMILVVDAQPSERRSLGIGLRYDSDLKTTALFSVNSGNQLPLGPRSELNLRLGENVRAEAAYIRPLFDRRRIWMRGHAQLSWTSINLFGVDGERLSRRRVQASEASLHAGRSFSSRATLSAGLHAEHYDTGDAIGVDVLPRGPGNLFGLTAHLRAGEIEASQPESAGYRISVFSDLMTDPGWAPFARVALDAQLRYPVGRGLTLRSRAAFGRLYGEEIPLHYRFYMGGTFAALPFESRQVPFLGYDVQAFSGRTLQAYTVSLRYVLPRTSFVELVGNVGSVESDYPSLQDTDGFRYGVGLVLGTTTMVGPVKVGLVAPDPSGPFEVAVNIGYVL